MKPDREFAIAPDKLRIAGGTFAFKAGIFDERPYFRLEGVGSTGAPLRVLAEFRCEMKRKPDGGSYAEDGGDGLKHRNENGPPVGGPYVSIGRRAQ
jgi:hypothetical protein